MINGWIEFIWGEILSRNPERVRAAFARLTAEEQPAVMEHLLKMSTEQGWHPEQAISAKEALTALKESKE